MPFTKGKSGNPKGKKKGTVAKANKDAKQLFVMMMEGEMAEVKDALAEVRSHSAFNYLVCLSKLMPYFMPKQIDMKSDGEKLAPPIIQIINSDEAQ